MKLIMGDTQDTLQSPKHLSRNDLDRRNAHKMRAEFSSDAMLRRTNEEPDTRKLFEAEIVSKM